MFSKLKNGLLIILLSVAMLLTGCGSQSPSNQPTSTQSLDVAYFALHVFPLTDLDPSAEATNVLVHHNLYETLLRYNPLENKFIPILATDYTKSEDGLTWTFRIRQGVKFHDGTDLNAEAVKFSIERTMQLGKGAAYIWDPVQSINTPDEYTVEFILKYPASLDLIVSSSYGAFIFSPTAAQNNPEDWFTLGHEAGTGPYMLESLQIGQECVITRFNDYWQGWDGKHFDKVVIRKIPESATRRQLLEKGEIDITWELPYEDVIALKDNPNINIYTGPSFDNLMIHFNTLKKPLDNKLVRKALSYAFPYEDVINYAMGSYAVQSRGPIPYGLWGHSDDLFQYKFDLEQAKKLLTEAGYPNGGFNLLLIYTAGDEVQKKAAELYKSELQKLGINLEIRGMPWESQWEMAKNPDPEQRQDMFTFYWWPDIISPYSILYPLFHSEEEILFNLSYWTNEEFDKTIDDAYVQSGIDREEAETMFIKAQELLVEEAPAIFAFDIQYVRVADKSFKGYEENPAYTRVVFFYNTYREKD